MENAASIKRKDAGICRNVAQMSASFCVQYELFSWKNIPGFPEKIECPMQMEFEKKVKKH